MSSDDFQSDEVPPPDFLVPGIRCGLEMALVGLIIGLVGLPAENALYFGAVLLSALLAMVVVLFWCVNRQMADWIRRAQGRPTITDGGHDKPMTASGDEP